MSDPIYKKGDVLILIDRSSVSANLGSTAVVQKNYYKNHEYIEVKWNRNELAKGQQDGNYYAKSFAPHSWKNRYQGGKNE